MKAARLLVLGAALAAGGAAAYFTSLGVEQKPEAPLTKITVGTLLFEIQSMFGANSTISGFTKRKTAFAPLVSVLPATNAS